MLINDEMFKRIYEGLLLKCVDNFRIRKIMDKLHEGLCGAHKLGSKM